MQGGGGRGGSRICKKGGGGRSGYRERHRREGFWRVPFEDPLWNFNPLILNPLRGGGSFSGNLSRDFRVYLKKKIYQNIMKIHYQISLCIIMSQ